MKVHVLRSHRDDRVFEIFGSRRKAESTAVVRAQGDNFLVSPAAPWFRGGNELMASDGQPTGYHVQSYDVQ